MSFRPYHFLAEEGVDRKPICIPNLHTFKWAPQLSASKFRKGLVALANDEPHTIVRPWFEGQCKNFKDFIFLLEIKIDSI